VGDSRVELEKIAVAAVFHDLGIWTNHTFDYIAPSVAIAREHLAARGMADWIPEVEAMIVDHHKVTSSRPNPHPSTIARGALSGVEGQASGWFHRQFIEPHLLAGGEVTPIDLVVREKPIANEPLHGRRRMQGSAPLETGAKGPERRRRVQFLHAPVTFMASDFSIGLIA
jgi:hypothetical protein